MPDAGDVSFELERFEWTADDRLEVVGRWNGVAGRRIARPALTIEAGGRRHRVSGSAEVEPDAWRASFPWDGSRGEIAGAELELGRSLVVELPQPRRRRRRRSGATAAESDLRLQIEELQAVITALKSERSATTEELIALRSDSSELEAARAENERLAAQLAAVRATRSDELEEARAEAERLAAELEAARTADDAAADLAAARAEAESLAADLDSARADAELLAAELEAARSEPDDVPSDELAGLRLAHGSLKAAHEQLEDEVEKLRSVRDERDELGGQLEQLRANMGDEEQQRAALGELMRALQQRATEAEDERDRLREQLSAAKDENARLERVAAEREVALRDAEADAARRLESERAAVTEVHSRLATAREEAQRTMVAEAEETERLREELAQARADGERALAAERAEVARLREELVSRDTEDIAEHDEASRRMLERVTRDLDRERATSRNLRRELEEARSESAAQRRALSSATANGTLSMDEPITPAPRRAVARPGSTQRRIGAARYAAESRVPQARPSRGSLWAVRIVATLTVAALGVALVILVSLFT